MWIWGNDFGTEQAFLEVSTRHTPRKHWGCRVALVRNDSFLMFSARTMDFYLSAWFSLQGVNLTHPQIFGVDSSAGASGDLKPWVTRHLAAG